MVDNSTALDVPALNKSWGYARYPPEMLFCGRANRCFNANSCGPNMGSEAMDDTHVTDKWISGIKAPPFYRVYDPARDGERITTGAGGTSTLYPRADGGVDRSQWKCHQRSEKGRFFRAFVPDIDPSPAWSTACCNGTPLNAAQLASVGTFNLYQKSDSKIELGPPCARKFPEGACPAALPTEDANNLNLPAIASIDNSSDDKMKVFIWVLMSVGVLVAAGVAIKFAPRLLRKMRRP